MTRKILQVGSSAGITIPKDALKELNIVVGDDVVLTVEGGTKIVIEALARTDKELNSWTKGFIEKYRPALEVLKDK